MGDEATTFPLDESDLPTHWVNLAPDLPEPPLPPLHPGTLQPAGPDDLAAIFPAGVIEQEVAAEPLVEIPDEVREAYRLWRPTPLFRAQRLKPRSTRPRTSTSSTRASPPPARTSPTARSRRPTRTRARACASS